MITKRFDCAIKCPNEDCDAELTVTAEVAIKLAAVPELRTMTLTAEDVTAFDLQPLADHFIRCHQVSLLAKALVGKLEQSGVYIAPTIGAEFVKPWPITSDQP